MTSRDKNHLGDKIFVGIAKIVVYRIKVKIFIILPKKFAM